MSNKRILVFIPAKNEATSVGKVIDGVREALPQESEAVNFLVLDDGSWDDTGIIAKQAGAEVIRNEVSRGLGSAFSLGLQHALKNSYEIMLTIDGDGQFYGSEAPKLLEPIWAGKADFVTGSRFLSEAKILGIPWIKKVGNLWMSRLISSIVGSRFVDVSCGFRAYSREAMAHLNLFGDFTYTQEVFLNLGFKHLNIIEVPISVKYYPERKSRMASNVFHYAWETIRIIFKAFIYYRPMRFFGVISAILFVLGAPLFMLLSIYFYRTGFISPYKSLYLASGLLVIFAFASFIVGVFMQIISRLQMSVDLILYHIRHGR